MNREQQIRASLMRQFPPRVGCCHACGTPRPKGRQRWCSDACSDRYHDLVSPDRLRRKLYAKDPHCETCRREVWVSVKPGDLGYGAKMDGDEARFGPVPIGFKMGPYDGAWRWRRDRKRGDMPLGEMDHRIPLAEGGEHAVENLRLLCTPCHKAETKALARRLAERRRALAGAGETA